MCGMYNKAMKFLFKQIPTMKSKHLVKIKTPKKMDRNWWWMVYGKITKGPPPIMKRKLIKNHKGNINYALITGIGKIVN